MATFERIDPGGDLNTGKSVFNISDSYGNLAQLSQEEAGQLMRWLRSFLEPLPSLHRAQEREQQEYTLYWHSSEMYAARLAYGDDRPLWGSERLEMKHGDRWIAGKVGQVGAASALVLCPREKADNPEYIVLTVGSIVRN